MFETALENALKTIFEVSKVTFGKVNEKAPEQNVLFVDVVKAVTTAKQTKQIARVTGEILLYDPNTKLKFGFFNKQLYKADAADTAPFYFYDMEENDKVTGDIVERKCKFIYFYSSEYDPEHGLITSIDLNF